ncbi:MAG: hypothetical protein ACRDJN_20155 [Chloroflexota bacterium]
MWHTMRNSWRRVLGGVAMFVFLLGATVTVAGAKPDKEKPDTDEVTNDVVMSTADGVVTGPGVGDSDAVFAAIPLSQSTFTHRAGEVLVISTRTEITRLTVPDQTDGGEHCDVHVGLTGFSDVPGWDFLIEDMHLLARRGDPGLWIDDAVIPGPPTDKVYQLEASVWSEKVQGNDFGETPPEQNCTDETVAASLRISFTTLRD